jgi:hypothetical protein
MRPDAASTWGDAMTERRLSSGVMLPVMPDERERESKREKERERERQSKSESESEKDRERESLRPHTLVA